MCRIHLDASLKPLVALPFPKRKGEVGCKALSSSIHDLWQENSLNTEHAETPRHKHAEKASDKQRTGAKMIQTAASACKIVAECCKQHSISRGPRSFDTTSQQLATQQIKEKRIARAHATRPERSGLSLIPYHTERLEENKLANVT